jgi:hypothetical protein
MHLCEQSTVCNLDATENAFAFVTPTTSDLGDWVAWPALVSRIQWKDSSLDLPSVQTMRAVHQLDASHGNMAINQQN